MRRRAPRPLAEPLAAALSASAPATVLARVQAVWPEVAGTAIAAEAEPVAENAGTLTLECRSAVWAGELELLGPDLLRRLNQAIGPGDEGSLRRLRARSTGSR